MITIAEGYSRDKRGAMIFPARPLRIARKALFLLIFISTATLILAGLMLDRVLGKGAVGTVREAEIKEKREA